MLRRAGFALVLVGLVGSTAVGQQWAQKMFQQTDHDFGAVARDSKTEYRFELENLYVEDVHIASISSSCGCTTPVIEKQLLKTYEKGAILAHVNTDRFRGQKGATLTVTFDKPFYAQVQLHVKAYIRDDIVVEPGSVQFGAIDLGTAAEKTVALSRNGNSDWKILGVKSSNPHLKVKIWEADRRGSQVRYGMKVFLDSETPAGYLNDHLLVVTNDYGRKELPVLVEGRVTPGVTVSPSSLFMGLVEPGRKVTKKLVVRGKKPFRILSITCEDESFAFDPSVVGGEAKTLHLVPVTFVAGESKGKVAKKIRIETDLGQMAPELPAYAVVSPQQ